VVEAKEAAACFLCFVQREAKQAKKYVRLRNRLSSHLYFLKRCYGVLKRVYISFVIKDLVYKAKAKAKDIIIFQGQHQGQLRQLPLQAKNCIAVTETISYTK